MKNYILIIGFVVLGGVNLFVLKSYSQNKAAIDLVHTEFNNIKEENRRLRQTVVLDLNNNSLSLDRKFKQLEIEIKRDISTAESEATDAYYAARTVGKRLDDLVEEKISDAISLSNAFNNLESKIKTDALTSTDLPFGAFSLRNAFDDVESKIKALSRKVRNSEIPSLFPQ